MAARNTYIIIRDDLLMDPVTIITEGLLIGRLRESEVLLNHPSVSRAQAGIKQIESDYYLFGLRPENPVKLNGRPLAGLLARPAIAGYVAARDRHLVQPGRGPRLPPARQALGNAAHTPLPPAFSGGGLAADHGRHRAAGVRHDGRSARST